MRGVFFFCKVTCYFLCMSSVSVSPPCYIHTLDFRFSERYQVSGFYADRLAGNVIEIPCFTVSGSHGHGKYYIIILQKAERTDSLK